MAHPITHTFEAEKQELYQKIPKIIQQSSMVMLGCHRRLGLISFYKNPQKIIYAHLVQQDNQQTEMSVAPGISMLAKKEQSVIPEAIINKLISKIANAI